MHDTVGVGKVEAAAHLCHHSQHVFQRQPAFRRVLDETGHVAASHQLRHHIRLGLGGAFGLVLTEIEHGHDVRMGTEPTHRLRLEGNPLPRYGIQRFDLDDGDRDVTVEEGVPGLVHLLPRSLADHSPQRITPINYRA